MSLFLTPDSVAGVCISTFEQGKRLHPWQHYLIHLKAVPGAAVLELCASGRELSVYRHAGLAVGGVGVSLISERHRPTVQS